MPNSIVVLLSDQKQNININKIKTETSPNNNNSVEEAFWCRTNTLPSAPLLFFNGATSFVIITYYLL